MPDEEKLMIALRFTAPIRQQPTVITDAEVLEVSHGPSAHLRILDVDLAEAGWDGRRMSAASASLRAMMDALRPVITDRSVSRIDIFAFASIPLLAMLGRLIGSKDRRLHLYQRHRVPSEGWVWQEDARADTQVQVSQVDPLRARVKDVAIKVCFSARVQDEQVWTALGAREAVIYAIGVRYPDRTFLKTREQLEAFNSVWRHLLDDINSVHGGDARLHIFAAAPIPICVELGRQPHPGVFSAVYVYDFANNAFTEGLDMWGGPWPASLPSTVEVPGGVAVLAPPGEHGGPMGCTDHRVQVDPFIMLATPVTVGQWEEVRRRLPDAGLVDRAGADPSLPVVNVTWSDALNFAKALSLVSGRAPAVEIEGSGKVRLTGGDGFRLPFEAEWALAAAWAEREGSRGPYRDTGGGVGPVGASTPEGNGLHHLLGNVWEWCIDPWPGRGAIGWPDGLHVDVAAGSVLGPDGRSWMDLRLDRPDTPRVVRGGGWDIESCLVDVSTRSFAPSREGNRALGFRLVAPLRAESGAVGSEVLKPGAGGAGVQPVTAGQGTFVANTMQVVVSGPGIQVNQGASGDPVTAEFIQALLRRSGLG